MARAAALPSLIPLTPLTANSHRGCNRPVGERPHRGERPARGGSAMAVNFTAIGKVAGLGSAPDLSAFSALVHVISGAIHKSFLRLRIGDGAFPKSARMRQNAPFDGAIH
jgi:hypothetical protein